MRGETIISRTVAIAVLALAAALAPGCRRVALVDDLGPDAGTDADADGDTGGDTDTDTDADSDGDTATDTAEEACDHVTVDLLHQPSTVLLLVDRSRSMYTNTVATETYAELVAGAIKTVVEDPIEEGMASFALSAFPSLDCPPDTEESEFECAPAEYAIVEPGPYNFAEIELALDAIGTCGGTPLCASLDWALDYLTDGLPDELADAPKYVLLATDGAPNCNPDADPESCTCTADTCMIPEQCLDDLCTYNAALSLAAAGVAVFVIGIGDDVEDWGAVLDNIALYGGTGEHYPAADEDAVEEAVEDVTGATIGCEFGVPWPLVPDDVEKSCDRVVVEGWSDGWEWILHEPECTGDPAWRWVGEPPEYDADTPVEEYCSIVELCPLTCEAFQDGLYTDVRAHIGCPSEMD